MQPRRRSDLLIVLALSTVLLSACVKQDDPKVGITKVEANLVFGVKEPPPVVQPPNQQVQEEIQTNLGKFGEINLDGPFLKLPPPAAVDGECPKAAPNAAAKDPADINVTGKPKEGIYRWQRGGEQKPAGAPENTPGLKISGFEKRILRNFKQVDPKTSTFETVQIESTRTAITSTFQVRTDALNETINPGAVVSPPRVGEPDRGLSLTKVETIDSKGEVVAAFNPTTPILYLPLPVVSGEAYRSVGVDPKTGQTLVHDATVLGRERIDACGDLVDGFAVEATQTSSVGGQAGPGAQVKYRYIVAPQYGAMIIAEVLSYSTTTIQNELRFTLGQLNPDPLPPTQG